MAAATEAAERVEPHVGGHTHPPDRSYIYVALILAVLTALETSTYFIPAFDDNSTLLVLFLLPVMAVKFGMVAWYFMHLKQDSRLFTRVFTGGVILAVGVYLVVLLAFDEFF
jgi:cytochrome c oxidase subunit 4